MIMKMMDVQDIVVDVQVVEIQTKTKMKKMICKKDCRGKNLAVFLFILGK